MEGGRGRAPRRSEHSTAQYSKAKQKTKQSPSMRCDAMPAAGCEALMETITPVSTIADLRGQRLLTRGSCIRYRLPSRSCFSSDVEIRTALQWLLLRTICVCVYIHRSRQRSYSSYVRSEPPDFRGVASVISIFHASSRRFRGSNRETKPGDHANHSCLLRDVHILYVFHV